jgi:hypothetical protein
MGFVYIGMRRVASPGQRLGSIRVAERTRHCTHRTSIVVGLDSIDLFQSADKYHAHLAAQTADSDRLH